MLARFPRTRLLLILSLSFFTALLLLRAGFYWYFLSGTDAPPEQLWKAFGIGARFDFRMALLMALPLGIISLLPGPFGLKGIIGKHLATAITTIAVGGMCLVYIFDFGHYAYLGVRLNASVLEFTADGSDSLQMLWESYPVISMVLMLIATCVITWLVISTRISHFRQQLPPPVWWRFALAAPVVIALYFFGILGKLEVGKIDSAIPLRWSDAFFKDHHPDSASLALSPVDFFIATYSNKSRPFDPKLVKKTYPLIADFLGVDEPDVKTMSFARKTAARPVEGKRPNVVFIHLESLGANRSGLYGNPLNGTPYMDEIARKGYFFPNFMVPSSGTARTVFGLITGIPDVTWGGSTGTRNPLISKQYTLVNAFEDYNKLYFIGGDAGWANIQGLLQNSINDLELWQMRDFSAPAVDVWGLSDNSLLVAANDRLNEVAEEKPFVAFIQLAGNHRPFTIPDEEIGFETVDVDLDTLYKYGFTNLAHYNAVRLQDYNLNLYLNHMVPASNYSENTIFLMYGDHNTRSVLPTAMNLYSEPLHLNNFHVPFIIYAPGIIEQPEVHEKVASLVDLLPTALGMTGLSYENRTMGRDLLNWKGESHAMIFGGDRGNKPTIGLLSQDDYLSMIYDGSNARYYKLDAAKDNVIDDHPDLVEQRKLFLHGMYQISTYMQTHNVVKD